MKFNVGYALRESDDFIDKIIEYKDRIGEVYFSFGDIPNGRNNQMRSEIFTPVEAMEKQMADLSKMSAAGLSFNLLLNGNCYGKDSLSRVFFNKIGDTVDLLLRRYGLSSVTTASPIIAKFIKQNFDSLEVRASVNMEIGTPEGVDYVADVFDGFYAKRELNRDFYHLGILKKHCDDLGKNLYGLANSGCLNYCSVHNFHDNLVSHESEISASDNAYFFNGKCWEYLKDPKNKKNMIRNTNFIRPEDVPLYEDYYSSLKLATRVNTSPIRVLTAYVMGRYYGGINAILEPNHSSVIAPAFLDNAKFPQDFAKTVGNCNKRCEECGYCTKVYETIYTEINGGNVYVDEPDDKGSGACGRS